VRKSPDWEKTLLIIIFDEHGGCYDHVPPPTTIAPDQAFIEKGNPGYSGFKFDHLGVRVPAVVISPFTRAGMVLNDVYDHTTILKTVMECFGMVDFVSNKLGDRAAKAKPLQEAVKLDVPRQDLPVIPTPPTLEVSAVQKTLALGKWLLHASEKPVTDLHKAALSEAAHRLGRADLVDQAQNAKSAFDAESVAMRVEVELWKRRHAKSPLMSISHW
jgi:phospholipase C